MSYLRHETYKSQYRAMFVFNCKIDDSEILKYAKEKSNNKRFKKKKKNIDVDTDSNNNNNEYDEYKAVYCATCNTKVGIYEFKQDLYHFFNVLSSH